MDTLVEAFYAAHPKYAPQAAREGGKKRSQMASNALPAFVRWVEKRRPEFAPMLLAVIAEMLPDMVDRDAAEGNC